MHHGSWMPAIPRIKSGAGSAGMTDGQQSMNFYLPEIDANLLIFLILPK